jgi:hypothetical protein
MREGEELRSTPNKDEVVARVARRYFPYFHTPPLELRDWILMDNAGGSQALKTVGERIT